MADPDELFNLKNHFYIGNFQLAIKEGSTLRVRGEAVKIERDVFVYRSYIAVGNYAVVLDEIKETASTPPDLLAVRLLATYLSRPAAKETCVLTAHQLLEDFSSNATVQLIVGTIFFHEENFSDALKAVRSTTDLQQMALTVQILVRISRLDLAQKHVKRMQTVDDESTLTQLANAWVNAASGGEKYIEARYAFQELIDKFGASVSLLNSLAVCHLALAQYEEAERLLIDAIGKSANDPDVLFNLISCAQHTNKPPEFVQRYTNQLKRAAPEHPLTQQLARLESMFDRVATQYGV